MKASDEVGLICQFPEIDLSHSTQGLLQQIELTFEVFKSVSYICRSLLILFVENADNCSLLASYDEIKAPVGFL